MKKRFVSIYFLFVSFFCITHLYADTTKGKTYVTLRNPGSRNIALTGWSELVSNKNKNKIGTNLTVAGFYGQSNNDKELGSALLAYGRNSFKIYAAGGSDGENGQNYVDNGGSSNDSISADSVSINPKQKRYGAQFNFLQNLDFIAPGLYIGVNTTAAQVVNNANFLVVNQNAAVKGLTVTTAFGGGSSSTSNQVALKYNILSNLDQKKTGICDAEFLVGFNLIDTEQTHLGVHAAAAFPTDSASTCTYLFEPRVGHQHWGFGGGANLSINLYNTNNISVNFAANGEYRYFFQELEKRTFDTLNRFTLAAIDFTRYVLVTDAAAQANQKVRPAANDLTQDFWLIPGPKFEGTALISASFYGATLNCGYNLFFKGAESGTLKEKWVDNKIGFCRPSFLITGIPNLNGVVNTTAEDDQTIDPINNAMLDYNSVFSASQLTHKIFLSMGYAATNFRAPFMINFGGAYELAERKTTALEGFEVWGKVGISF